MQFYDHLYRPDLIEELLKGDIEGKYKNASNLLNLESILRSGAPPKFERLQNREIKNGNKVRLAVRLIDRGGGIGEKVIWRGHGVVQGATSVPGLGGPVSPGRYVVMEQTFTFDPDPKVKNEVSVVAYNRRGLLATTPFKLTVDPSSDRSWMSRQSSLCSPWA